MVIPPSQKVPQSIRPLVLAELVCKPGAQTGTWNVVVCANNLDKCLLSFSPPTLKFLHLCHTLCESCREHLSFASLLVHAFSAHHTHKHQPDRCSSSVGFLSGSGHPGIIRIQAGNSLLSFKEELTCPCISLLAQSLLLMSNGLSQLSELTLEAVYLFQTHNSTKLSKFIGFCYPDLSLLIFFTLNYKEFTLSAWLGLRTPRKTSN